MDELQAMTSALMGDLDEWWSDKTVPHIRKFTHRNQPKHSQANLKLVSLTENT